MTFLRAARFNPQGVIDEIGRAQSGAAITLLESNGLTLATRYLDSSRTSIGPNPWAADGSGNFTFFADPGDYVLSVMVGGSTTSFAITVSNVPAEDAAPGSDAWLKRHAANPGALLFGTLARNSDGVITSADVIWPDGTAGTYTTLTIDATFVVNSYRITYGSPALLTATQPAVTRDETGAITNRPEITIS